LTPSSLSSNHHFLWPPSTEHDDFAADTSSSLNVGDAINAPTLASSLEA
jgi:hypothetical protein